jgi:hypothetical protein
VSLGAPKLTPLGQFLAILTIPAAFSTIAALALIVDRLLGHEGAPERFGRYFPWTLVMPALWLVAVLYIIISACL